MDTPCTTAYVSDNSLSRSSGHWCSWVITIYLADEFSTDAFSASLNGLIFYVTPVVSVVVPVRLKLAALQAFEETRY